MTSPSERPACGHVVGDLEIVGDLGSGLSGDVFLVRRQGDPNRTYVLKRHRRKKDGVTDECFCGEIRLVEEQPIRGHMPDFIAKGEDNGTPYYVMSREGPLPEKAALTIEQWLDWTLELVNAFELLNGRRHIFHRDVKPKNLRSTDGHPVIIDFGLACRNDTDTPFPFERVGSRDYMAPEIVRYEPYTVQSEIYSTMKSVQAILPDEARHALSAALFHATENAQAQRTPSWSALRTEIGVCRAAYRREHHRLLTALKRIGIVVGFCGAIFLVINGLVLVWRILTLYKSD